MVDQFYLNSFVEELIEDLIDVSKEKKIIDEIYEQRYN